MLLLIVCFREFEATLDHMQLDIDSLEQEKSELKQRLTQLSKRTLFESITRTAAPSGIAAVVTGASGQGLFESVEFEYIF